MTTTVEELVSLLAPGQSVLLRRRRDGTLDVTSCVGHDAIQRITSIDKISTDACRMVVTDFDRAGRQQHVTTPDGLAVLERRNPPAPPAPVAAPPEVAPPCPDCAGSGLYQSLLACEPCRACEGSGRLRRSKPAGNGLDCRCWPSEYDVRAEHSAALGRVEGVVRRRYSVSQLQTAAEQAGLIDRIAAVGPTFEEVP